MQKLFIFFVLAAVAYCAPVDEPVPILKSVQDQDTDGSWVLSYETGDGITRDEVGKVINPGTETAYASIVGSYRYTSPEGLVVEVNYTADENGFVPFGPLIPEAISKNAKHLGSIKTT